jgi:branched-chain amino acid transport system ATP-binding protein
VNVEARPAPLLRLDRLSKRFGAITVADALSLEVAAGTCLGVVGPNGAGKTSLFNMITGALRPDTGAVWFEGRDITGYGAHARVPLGIMRAFQIPQPFPHLTVYENVLMAAHYGAGLTGRRAEASCVSVLERLGLAAKGDQPAGQLRLLDRKRLELAKAMASRARLLLLDEIAGGLTDREVDDLLALIETLKRDHTIVWIEHIPRALKAVADRVVVLNFGRLLLDDHPEAVMASGTFREIYMGLPASAA